MPAYATADPFLALFFDEHRAMTAADQRSAVDGLACDLRFAVEVEGERFADRDDAVLLAAERQFDRLGAVGRVLGLQGLVQVLERYAADPVYRPSDPADAKLRVETCSALLRRLALRPELAGRARQLRRADEAIRIEAGSLGPLRRLRVRRVRS